MFRMLGLRHSIPRLARTVRPALFWLLAMTFVLLIGGPLMRLSPSLDIKICTLGDMSCAGLIDGVILVSQSVPHPL